MSKIKSTLPAIHVVVQCDHKIMGFSHWTSGLVIKNMLSRKYNTEVYLPSECTFTFVCSSNECVSKQNSDMKFLIRYVKWDEKDKNCLSITCNMQKLF
jgi:hypothetical protein